jgi:hypothetical protein
MDEILVGIWDQANSPKFSAYRSWFGALICLKIELYQVLLRYGCPALKLRSNSPKQQLNVLWKTALQQLGSSV